MNRSLIHLLPERFQETVYEGYTRNTIIPERSGCEMTRRLVLVEIDSPTPLDAEVQVAFALAEAGLKGTYVRQTNVVLASATEGGGR